jgi:hypothetical protein
MSGACDRNGKKRNTHQISMGNMKNINQSKRFIGWMGYREMDFIKVLLEEL